MGTLGVKIFKRCFSLTNNQRFKVALIGASGGIGQPLALLLKSSPLIKELKLHDLKHVEGVAADVSHINTHSKVTFFKGQEKMKECIKGCQLVVVTAGVPRKPGMTRDDLFESNAIVAKTVAEVISEVNPEVFLHIITNPLNSIVPVVCATYTKLKKGNPQNVFGIVTLDTVRACTFVGEMKQLDPSKIKVPVIGGHAGETIVPLLSMTEPKVNFTEDEINKITTRIQNAGTEIVKAKAGQGSSTLSMAFAAARTAIKFLRGLKGEPNMFESCYVKSDVTKSRYFSTPLKFGKNGIEKNLGVATGTTSDEHRRMTKAIKILAGSIAKGESYAKK